MIPDILLHCLTIINSESLYFFFFPSEHVWAPYKRSGSIFTFPSFFLKLASNFLLQVQRSHLLPLLPVFGISLLFSDTNWRKQPKDTEVLNLCPDCHQGWALSSPIVLSNSPSYIFFASVPNAEDGLCEPPAASSPGSPSSPGVWTGS